MQAIINFYNDKIKTNVPKTFSALKQAISEHFMIDMADVNEMVITSQIANEKKEIKNEKDFQEAIKEKKDLEIDVEISEKSQLFQKEEKNLLDKCKEAYQNFDFQQVIPVVKDVAQKVQEKAQMAYKFAELSLQNTVKNAEKSLESTTKKIQGFFEEKPQEPKPVEAPKQPEVVPQKKPVKVAKKPVVKGKKKPVAKPVKKPVPVLPKFINGKPVHTHYICDGCEKHPIVGIRYKCTVCPDFDYCEECEKKFGDQHGHPFLKIRTPECAPVYIHCEYPGLNQK
ncbi:MAG: hypothetical protein MJ252_23400 [archaeon]|nr:hypothetical protein [archaeon]